MNLFILRSRSFICALLALVAVESSLHHVLKPSRIQKSNFLNLSYAKEDSFQRLVLHDKLINFAQDNYDVIQVGDSSGFHGVIPTVLEATNPGYNYINMSVATNLGYGGYLHVADYMLDRNPSASHLILYISPVGGFPRKLLWDQDPSMFLSETSIESMSDHIYRELLSPYHNLVQLPSQMFRQNIIDPVFYYVPYHLGGHKLVSNRLKSNNRGYLMFNDSFNDTDGWARETDNPGDVDRDLYANMPSMPEMDVEYFFSLSKFKQLSYIDAVIDSVNELALKHNVKVSFIFNPIPQGLKDQGWTNKIKVAKLLHALKVSASRYNTITVPDKFDYWADEKFSAFSHIKGPYALENSLRVSNVLSSLLPPRYAKLKSEPDFTPVTINADEHFSGYSWPSAFLNSKSQSVRPISTKPAFIFKQLQASTDYIVNLSLSADSLSQPDDIQLSANGVTLELSQQPITGDSFQYQAQLPQSLLRETGGFLNLSLKSNSPDPSSQFSSISFQPL